MKKSAVHPRLPRRAGFRLAAGLFGLLGLAVPGSAQTDEHTCLDVVSIQNRPGFLKAVQDIAEGREQDGLRVLESLDARYGGDPDVYILRYNLACAHARLHELEAGLQCLDAAVQAGYGVQAMQVRRLLEDPDLEPLRKSERFAEIHQFAADRSERIARDFDSLHAPRWVAPDDLKDGERLPVLMVFHPFGSSAEQFVEYFREFAKSRRFLVVAPNASKLIAPGRWAWAGASGDFLTQFRFAHRDGLKALQDAGRRLPVDESRLYVAGLGQGAALAFAYVVRNPQKVRGGIAINGGYAPKSIEEWLPVCVAQKRRVVMIHSTANAFFPIDDARGYAAELKAQGLDLMWRELEADHGLPPQLDAELDQAIAWIDAATAPEK